jgi:multiphosphoryl transfer protein
LRDREKEGECLMTRYSRECVIKNEHGIHARPSSLIVGIANKSKVPPKTVFIESLLNKVVSDSTSIMNIMMLAASKGTRLRIFTDDQRFKAVVDELAKAISEMEYT